MARGTLYGSLTSPYSRLARLVLDRSGARAHVDFEPAQPFDEGFRVHNPLGKVPALKLADGTLCLETTLIVRALNSLGDKDLFPSSAERLAAEADVALLMGVLDLGVAYRLESTRPESEQSAHWQSRRLAGLEAAFPAMEQAALRAADNPDGVTALALVCTADWLSFRLADVVPWQSQCPKCHEIVSTLLRQDDVAATDPRVG